MILQNQKMIFKSSIILIELNKFRLKAILLKMKFKNRRKKFSLYQLIYRQLQF